jgi:hypothetical protein
MNSKILFYDFLYSMSRISSICLRQILLSRITNLSRKEALVDCSPQRGLAFLSFASIFISLKSPGWTILIAHRTHHSLKIFICFRLKHFLESFFQELLLLVIVFSHKFLQCVVYPYSPMLLFAGYFDFLLNELKYP